MSSESSTPHVPSPIGTAPPGRKRRGAHRHLAPVRTRPRATRIRAGSSPGRHSGMQSASSTRTSPGTLRQFDLALDPTRHTRSSSACGRRCSAFLRRDRVVRRDCPPDRAPSAVRAVGAANGQNPLSIVVPCHRVIGSDGRLVGYGGGLPVKSALSQPRAARIRGTARHWRAPRQGVRLRLSRKGEHMMYDRDAIERIRRMRESWEARELRQFVDRQPESRSQYRTALRPAAPAHLHPGGRRRDAVRGDRAARPVPVHPWPVPHDVPRAPLDHATDRRLRNRRRHERAVPLPDRPGPDGALRRLRHAHPDGLRLRRSPIARRGGARGSRRRHARRRRRPLRRDRSRAHLGVDDDQPDRVDPPRDVRRARRVSRARPQPPVGHRAGGHPQGVHRPEGVDLPHPAVDAARCGT